MCLQITVVRDSGDDKWLIFIDGKKRCQLFKDKLMENNVFGVGELDDDKIIPVGRIRIRNGLVS
jgi:hypothetical protein